MEVVGPEWVLVNKQAGHPDYRHKKLGRTNILIRRNLAFPLYRYMNKEHVENFFKNGSLRVPTLFSFRDESQVGKSGVDFSEGILNVKVDNQCKILSAVNQYVFCTTKLRNDRIKNHFGGSGLSIKSIDFFYEITKCLPHTDMATLDFVKYENKKDGNYLCIDRPDRRFSADIKDNSFFHEDEVRMMWQPAMNGPSYRHQITRDCYVELAIIDYEKYLEVQNNLSVEFIKCPAARAYCDKI